MWRSSRPTGHSECIVHDNLCLGQRPRSLANPGNFHPTPKISFEISSSIVRWYGHARIERFLNRLYQLAKQEGRPWRTRNLCKLSDQDLSFLDLVCLNVYLESRDSWKRYLGRLQNLAGERPLLLAEVGLDTQRNGEVGQAQALRWLIQGAFASGCAGAFVFGWTDEWYRGGFEILDWDFGLTRRDRTSKAALETPGIYGGAVPGGEVLAQHLGCGLQLQRPSHHSGYLVVDDGSSPPLEPLVAPYGFRTIRTLNRGLSAARNIGLEAAGGEIVANLDDDAYPDQDWLTYLADSSLMSGVDHSVREVITFVERVTGRKARVTLQPRRPGDPAVLVANASRAEQAGLEGARFIDGVCCGNGLCLVPLLPQNCRKGGPETCPHPWCGRRVVAASASLFEG